MIQRPEYINRLLKFKDANIIKILVGVRRCGKSTVLDMYKDVLINEYNISKENIVKKRYKTMEFFDDYDANDMYKDIKEVQMASMML